ncbi:MAG TPA: aminoglycoside phosphotransferase family protein [Methanomicrobia archaeon]|nr:aminoglycoside phosphotransferase family protein [Methanomicrobia archaeon]
MPQCNTEALHRYLVSEIFPQIAPPPYGHIEIQRLIKEKPVYLFHERKRGIRVIGKFFESDHVPRQEAWRYAKQSYANLKHVREDFGMDNGRYRVVAPLGLKRELAALLVTELAPGKLLDHYIARACYDGQSDRLFEKLSCLAGFFTTLHRTSETQRHVSPALAQQYLDKVLKSLQHGPLRPSDRDTIKKHAARWWTASEIFTDHEVTVHGDATPTNFFFHHQEVVGIDLEKLKPADRCWDLGFFAAELKHHFMWRLGDRWAAEPFIGHFLWVYAVTLGDPQFFYTITRKLPLYMSLGLLRIARNTWLDEPYRSSLLQEARRCLKYGL